MPISLHWNVTWYSPHAAAMAAKRVDTCPAVILSVASLKGSVLVEAEDIAAPLLVLGVVGNSALVEIG